MRSKNAVHAAMILAAAAGAISTSPQVVRALDAQPTAQIAAQARNMAPADRVRVSASPSIAEMLMGSGFGGSSGRIHYPKRPPGSVARDKRMARKRRNVHARSAK